MPTRLTGRLLFISMLGLLLSGCGPWGNAAPVVKIGLIAPFEGQGRPLGYAVLPVVQEAIAEANSSGELHGFRASLVALDDSSYGPDAASQARVLVLDPDVVAVVGPWSSETLDAASPVLASEGLATIGVAPAPVAAGLANVCPALDDLAAELLAKAHTMGDGVVVAGPENALASALTAMEPEAVRLYENSTGAIAPTAAVIHTGRAETAAKDLTRWREAGWSGPLVGGPDMAQPWFGALAGKYAEGVHALVCGGLTPEGANQQGARVAAEAAVSALGSAIGDTGEPSRSAVMAGLAHSPPPVIAQWYRFSTGTWLHDAGE